MRIWQLNNESPKETHDKNKRWNSIIVNIVTYQVVLLLVPSDFQDCHCQLLPQQQLSCYFLCFAVTQLIHSDPYQEIFISDTNLRQPVNPSCTCQEMSSLWSVIHVGCLHQLSTKYFVTKIWGSESMRGLIPWKEKRYWSCLGLVC